jgi:hypothetical protein
MTDSTADQSDDSAATFAIAFEGPRKIASGPLPKVAVLTKHVIDRGETGPVFIFNARTSQPIEIDFRGSVQDVLDRLDQPQPAPTPQPKRGPGRPRLGVVAREVTMLPRHWEWLNAQPGGASVTLRRLVDDARRNAEQRHDVRGAREIVYRFMSPMAGNLFGFEEATRALYRDDAALFEALISEWPEGIRDHLQELAVPAFTREG